MKVRSVEGFSVAFHPSRRIDSKRRRGDWLEKKRPPAKGSAHLQLPFRLIQPRTLCSSRQRRIGNSVAGLVDSVMLLFKT